MKLQFFHFYIFTFLLFSGCAYHTVEQGDLGPPVSYQTDIRPIIVTNCYKCHSDTSTNVDKNPDPNTHWDHFDKLQAAALTPSLVNPSYSKLMARLRHIETPGMPYDKPNPLPDSLLLKIENWIQQGAPNN